MCCLSIYMVSCEMGVPCNIPLIQFKAIIFYRTQLFIEIVSPERKGKWPIKFKSSTILEGQIDNF